MFALRSKGLQGRRGIPRMPRGTRLARGVYLRQTALLSDGLCASLTGDPPDATLHTFFLFSSILREFENERK